MPGVLMLEALTQAGAWLIRDMEDFAHSIIVLKQAKTIKYGSFVEPGRQLELRVELTSHDAKDCSFKGAGMIDGQEMVKGRFTLTRYNLRDKDPELHATDSVDRRGASRPVRDPPERLGRCAGHRASARSAGTASTGLGRVDDASFASSGADLSSRRSTSSRQSPNSRRNRFARFAVHCQAR